MGKFCLLYLCRAFMPYTLFCKKGETHEKITMLTSCLALTACFGGGGNGVTGGPASGDGMLRASTLLGSAASDNSEITSMASAIVVTDGYASTSKALAATTPTTRTYNGRTYNVYKLENIDFNLIGSSNAAFNFNMNDAGRIVSATYDGHDINRGTGEDSDKFVARIFQLTDGDNDLGDPILFIPGTTTQADLDNVRNAYLAQHTEIVDPSTITWDYMVQSWDFDTKGDSQDLTYADFGKFTSANLVKMNNASISGNAPTGTDRPTDHSTTMLFAGGYAIDSTGLHETLTPTGEMDFSGKAIGRVSTSIQTNGGEGANRRTYLDNYDIAYNVGDQTGDSTSASNYLDPSSASFVSSTTAGHDMAQVFEANSTLHFENGVSTLTMPFASQGFYNVEVVDTGNNNPTFTFSDWNGGDAKTYKMDSSVNGTEKFVKTGYYGINTPTEAAGAVMYKTEKILDGASNLNNANAIREWEFQAAYGMKPVTPTE